jgi:hypothetical protein
MTPTQMIDGLKLPHHKVERLKALKASCDELEDIIRGDLTECVDTPFHKSQIQQTQSCVNLIAQILKENPDTVLETLLALFGLTESQFLTTSKSLGLVVAFSRLVENTLQP